MEQDDIDKKRREFLIKTTVTMGGLGLIATTIPFIASMLPGVAEDVAAGPVKVDVSQMKPGDQKTVLWQGRPVWVVRRTPQELASLSQDTALLRDPNSNTDQQPPYARNLYRSIKPEYLVLVGVCTHLGCIPTYRPEPNSVQPDWPGGFFCTCHGSKFDMAGRVFKGVPAPINLLVPPYKFINDQEILVGEGE
ncbi:MAG: ubiquinol-cytochrome c reductase iron-sulfur subunit [Gammaproteobacteria bacterium]